VANDTVLFFGHELSAASCSAFEHLRASAGGGRTVRWLLDTAADPVIPADLRGELATFDSRAFAGWGYATFGDRMLPGHCHFPALQYYRAQPDLGHLWVIEYDVRFTGPWRLFLDHFDACEADLLTCHVRTRAQEPRWHWWDSLRDPQGAPLAGQPQLRCLLVVARYSAAALQRLTALHSAGWRGHQEVLVPTLLAREGLAVRDINDPGSGAAARRFYTSRTSAKGRMGGWFATLRYRPAHRRAGWRRNMLYHPVKPAGWNESP
jgi:hypothetical protein